MRGAFVLLLIAGCSGQAAVIRPETPVAAPTEPQPESPTDALRGVLTAFCDAAERREFKTVLGLLAAPLRQRYTAERLGGDFGREPLAKERLQRLRGALGEPIEIHGARAALRLDDVHAVELVQEEGAAWRIAALE